jgi:hypothetical protein
LETITPARRIIPTTPYRAHAARVLFTPHHKPQSSQPKAIALMDESEESGQQSSPSEMASELQRLSLGSSSAGPAKKEKRKAAKDVWVFFEKRERTWKGKGRGRGKGKSVGDREEMESVCTLCL